MSHPKISLEALRLFLTTEMTCNYRFGQRSRNLVADPDATNHAVYAQLAELGFRRSGGYIYRPHCRTCVACRSLRIPVVRFTPDRSQRRTLARNQDLKVRIVKAAFYEEHFALFSRYVVARHPGGGMDAGGPTDYWSFIESRWCPTWMAEFRQGQRLLAVAIVDVLREGLSAVYTFFDPVERARSLGVYAILWQIAEAQRQGLRWLYLGYWVADCRKMAYKIQFNPHELFVPEQRRWIAGSGAVPVADGSSDL